MANRTGRWCWTRPCSVYGPRQFIRGPTGRLEPEHRGRTVGAPGLRAGLWRRQRGGEPAVHGRLHRTNPNILINEVCFTNPLGCGWLHRRIRSRLAPVATVGPPQADGTAVRVSRTSRSRPRTSPYAATGSWRCGRWPRSRPQPMCIVRPASDPSGDLGRRASSTPAPTTRRWLQSRPGPKPAARLRHGLLELRTRRSADSAYPRPDLLMELIHLVEPRAGSHGARGLRSAGAPSRPACCRLKGGLLMQARERDRHPARGHRQR